VEWVDSFLHYAVQFHKVVSTRATVSIKPLLPGYEVSCR